MHTAHAGVISDAPSIGEIIVSALQALLQFAGALSVLIIIIAGIMYIMSSGESARIDLAKKALIGSVAGLVVILLALMIVSQIAQTIGG